jgi:hypothetical protein
LHYLHLLLERAIYVHCGSSTESGHVAVASTLGTVHAELLIFAQRHENCLQTFNPSQTNGESHGHTFPQINILCHVWIITGGEVQRIHSCQVNRGLDVEERSTVDGLTSWAKVVS